MQGSRQLHSYLTEALGYIEETGYWNDLFIRHLNKIKGDDIFHVSFPTMLFRVIIACHNIITLFSAVQSGVYPPQTRKDGGHNWGEAWVAFINSFYCSKIQP